MMGTGQRAGHEESQETRTALCPSLMAMRASYIESYSIVLVVVQSHWTSECQCPSASGTEQLGRSAKLWQMLGTFLGALEPRDLSWALLVV